MSSSGHSYDVTGATAGGLVGSSTATITNSYSTCSVSGTTAAGGFAGSASGTITNCYATGLLNTNNITEPDDREVNKNKGAFVGSISGTVSDCKYYMIINEVKLSETKNDETVYTLDHYLGAVGDTATSSGIKPLDLNADTYNSFAGAFKDWYPAIPYDLTSGTIIGLDTYYSGKYPLETVYELNTNLPSGDSSWNNIYAIHYGDWPSPEVFFINTSS